MIAWSNVGLPASLETDRCFDPLAKLMAGVTEQAADADPKIGRRMSVKELKLADRVFGVVSRRSKFLMEASFSLETLREEPRKELYELFQEDWFKEAP